MHTYSHTHIYRHIHAETHTHSQKHKYITYTHVYTLTHMHTLTHPSCAHTSDPPWWQQGNYAPVSRGWGKSVSLASRGADRPMSASASPSWASLPPSLPDGGPAGGGPGHPAETERRAGSGYLTTWSPQAVWTVGTGVLPLDLNVACLVSSAPLGSVATSSVPRCPGQGRRVYRTEAASLLGDRADSRQIGLPSTSPGSLTVVRGHPAGWSQGRGAARTWAWWKVPSHSL